MRRLRVVGLVGGVALLALVAMAGWSQPDSLWRGLIVRSVPTDDKVVALTFDDGPDPRFTPKILAILDKYHVPATFFMIGRNVEAHPDIVRQVARRGDAIGNHTYTHPRNLELDTRPQLLQELSRCENTIQSIAGEHAYLFRPPRGFINGKTFAVVNKEGYRTVLWTVCADHHDAPTPELMAQRVLKAVKPGSIILAHDGTFGTRWKDVAATPIIIRALRKDGYRFVTVPELLRMK